MAKRTYQVKKGDNYSNLGYDPQVLMNLNPGVSRLSTGQKIFVPGDIGSGSSTRAAAYGGSYNPTVRKAVAPTPERLQPFLQRDQSNDYRPEGTFLSRMQERIQKVGFFNYFFGSPQVGHLGRRHDKGGNVNPMLVPVQNGFAGMNAGSGTGTFYPPVIKDPSYQTPPPPYTGTAGYWAGYNQANQGLQTGGSLSGDKQGQTPPLTQTVSRAEGRAQFLSGNGVNPDSGYIPTRADVWNMKANARRKKMSKMSGDEVQASYSSGVVSVPVDMTNNGNFVNSAVSWRVG